MTLNSNISMTIIPGKCKFNDLVRKIIETKVEEK